MDGQWNQFRDYNHQREQFIAAISRSFPQDEHLLLRALEFAERAHAGQMRNEGDPYIIHPVRAARFLIESMDERDPSVIAATLLHDVVEDTNVTLEEIVRAFGARVAQLVESVTRPRTKEETEGDKWNTKPEAYRKVLRSGRDAIRMKAADLLDNLRSWESNMEMTLSSTKLKRWLVEAQQWYIPIGVAAGCGIDNEMRRIVQLFEH